MRRKEIILQHNHRENNIKGLERDRKDDKKDKSHFKSDST